MRTLDLGTPASQPAWRPPDGAQLAFTGGSTAAFAATGLYVANSDGTAVQTLVVPSTAAATFNPHWAPDGSRLSYSVVDWTVQDWTVHTRIIGADGSGDHPLPMPAGARWNDTAAWSNDGKRLVMTRGYSRADASDVVAAIVPADGSEPGIEAARGALVVDPLGYEWAPDDSTVLVAPRDAALHVLDPVLLDPATGAIRPTTWGATSLGSWQRNAP